MKVLVSYRGIPQSPGWATGDFVVKALRTLGHEVYPYAKYYQQNKWVEDRSLGSTGYRSLGLDDHEFDLILYMECNDGDPQYSELAVARARKTACWLFDTSYYHDRCKSIVDYFRFDHVFLANPLTIREYKVWGYKNVSCLRYGFDSEKHTRSSDTEKTIGVALVGSIRDDRKALAKALKDHGINLELISGKFREEYVDALASARIIVNQNPPEGRGLLNMRFFEAQAAGCYVLTEQEDYDANHQEGTGMRYGALNGCYSSMSDLADQCREALGRRGLIRPEVSGLREAASLYHWSLMVGDSYESRCQDLMHLLFPHETTTDYFSYKK